MMDGWMRFLDSANIQCHYKAGKSQDIIQYNSDCVRLKEKKNDINIGWLEILLLHKPATIHVVIHVIE